jgi:hypothetical protein
LNDRQVKAILFLEENEKITNSDYQKINVVSRETATKDLKELISGLKGNFITIIDEDYPEEFKTIKFPPFVIFLSKEDRDMVGGDSHTDFNKYELTKKEDGLTGEDVYFNDEEDEGSGGMDA